MIFRRGKNGETAALAQLEAELSRSRERRDGLNGQLVEAQRALDAALVARRRELVEDDADTGSQGKDEVLPGREEVDALADAVEEVDSRIAHLESRIGQERAKLFRAEAAAELASHVKKLADAIATLKTSAAGVVGALPEVLSRVPFSNPNLPRDLAGLLLINVIDVNLGDVVKAANTHREALLRGDGPIRHPDVAMPRAAPPPEIARVDCLLIADSSWSKNGEAVTASRWTIRGLPLDVAERAIKLGWAFAASSDVVKRLLETNQLSINGAWHSPDPRACIDLATVTKRPPPDSFGQSLGVCYEATPETGVPRGAKVTIGESIEGTASVAR
jgi:hypothetical protein